MTGPELPEGRYGRRTRATPRWVRALLLGLVVLAGVAVAVVGYRNLADPPIEGQRLGFELLDGNAVRLRFEVVRDEPHRPGVCIVRARSLDGTETGRREVYVPAAEGGVALSAVIRTSRPPVTADVYGCSLRVPAYLEPVPPSSP
ncbi:MAG: DUF4307 domain-containing protein [Pseudonocardiaceae bacterium]|nr:DUF4307 domain-containing protein [Pseudonocardiaceae bacterium]